MDNYKITFIGRKSGDIGITYKIVEKVASENEDTATLELYKKGYEHIRVLRVEVIP